MKSSVAFASIEAHLLDHKKKKKRKYLRNIEGAFYLVFLGNTFFYQQSSKLRKQGTFTGLRRRDTRFDVNREF